MLQDWEAGFVGNNPGIVARGRLAGSSRFPDVDRSQPTLVDPGYGSPDQGQVLKHEGVPGALSLPD